MAIFHHKFWSWFLGKSVTLWRREVVKGHLAFYWKCRRIWVTGIRYLLLWIPSDADLTHKFLFLSFISYQSWQDPDICRKMFRKEKIADTKCILRQMYFTPNVFHTKCILHQTCSPNNSLKHYSLKIIQRKSVSTDLFLTPDY